MSRTAAHSLWPSLALLALALVLSVAVGSVFIPPATMLDLLRSRLLGSDLPAALKPFATISLRCACRALCWSRLPARRWPVVGQLTRGFSAIRWLTRI